MKIMKHRKMILFGLILVAGFAVSMWVAHNTAAHTAFDVDPTPGDPMSEQNYFVSASTSADTYGYVNPPPSGSPSHTSAGGIAYAWAQVDLLSIAISSENPSSVEASAAAGAPGIFRSVNPPSISLTLRRYPVIVGGKTVWVNSPASGSIAIVASVSAHGTGGYYHYARAESDADSYEISSHGSHGGRNVGIPRYSVHDHIIP